MPLVTYVCHSSPKFKCDWCNEMYKKTILIIKQESYGADFRYYHLCKHHYKVDGLNMVTLAMKSDRNYVHVYSKYISNEDF